MIIVYVLLGIFVFLFFREVIRRHNLERKIPEIRANAIKKSREVIEGNVAQQLMPYFPQYKYTPSDSRFMGSPLDFVVFDGLSKDNVKEVIFIEVKTGKNYPTKRQRSVKKAIENGKVRYELLRMERDNEK